VTKAELQGLRNQWATRVAEFQASGQSVSAWCAEQQVKPHQLRYWLKKHSQAVGNVPTQWLSLNLRDLANPPLVIRIGQATVEVRPGFDPDLLRDVVRALAQ